jgi:crotonobetaine/carnitine-CoA ligase
VSTEQAASVYEVVAAHALERPHSPAFTCRQRTWSYQELVDESSRLAHGLTTLGVLPGQRIGVVTAARPETVLTWLAAARIGIVPVMFNPSLTADELALRFELLDLSALVIDGTTADKVVSVAPAQTRDRLIRLPADDDSAVSSTVFVSWAELLERGSTSLPYPTSSDICEIAMTSGTSGRPKAAVFTNGAHVWGITSVQRHFRLTAADVCYCAVPLFHASGMRAATLVTLFAGGHVQLVERFSATEFWADCRRLGVTYTTIVETMALFLERQPVVAGERDHPVRLVFTNGTAELLNRFEERFGVRCVGPYGSTEFFASALTPIDVPVEQLAKARIHPAGFGYCGQPIDGIDIEVRGLDGSRVADGDAGELFVRSPGAMREYFRDPLRTNETLVDGWVRLGDLGARSADGSIYFGNRLGDSIKRAGELISPLEIEDAMNAHPLVAHSAAVGVPDEVRQEEVKIVIVVRDGRELTADDVWDWCGQRLAPYKVPRYVEFRPELPLGASGKVLRSELKVSDPARVHDRASRRR